MSELKAGVLVTPHNEGMCFHRSSAVIAVTERETEFYLKSEADKVIAEKDGKIAELEMKVARAQLVLRLNKPEALFSDLEIMGRLRHEIDVVARRERHHKYKRCLAMAKICENRLGSVVKPGWWDKWRKIWLALADEPTCAKFLQLIHKEEK